MIETVIAWTLQNVALCANADVLNIPLTCLTIWLVGLVPALFPLGIALEEDGILGDDISTEAKFTAGIAGGILWPLVVVPLLYSVPGLVKDTIAFFVCGFVDLYEHFHPAAKVKLPKAKTIRASETTMKGKCTVHWRR